jgi:hypothetical protein
MLKFWVDVEAIYIGLQSLRVRSIEEICIVIVVQKDAESAQLRPLELLFRYIVKLYAYPLSGGT